MWFELLIGSLVVITLFSLIFSLPLYSLVLSAIVRHRSVEPFSSEFFTVFIALGFADISCYLLFLTKKVFLLGYIPVFLQPFNRPNVIASLYYYPFWVFAFLQYQFTFVLTINRFASVIFPTFYEKKWDSAFTKQVIVFCIVFSMIISCPVLTSNCQITQYWTELDNTTHILYYGPMTTDRLTERYLKYCWAFHVYGLLISSVLFYGTMLVKLRSTKFIDNRRRVEMQLVVSGFMIFLLNLVFTVYFIIRDTIPTHAYINSHLHEWLLYFISDIYDLPNGLMLWLTSSPIRDIIFKSLNGKSAIMKRLIYGTAISPEEAPTTIITITALHRHSVVYLKGKI